MSPKVSILIPVHNREEFLGPCIESALSQTLGDVEVIVCDNASTDGTWSVCTGFAAKDSRVRAYRNERDIGPIRNWARCMELAQCSIAKLLFSDDLMLPGYLETTVPFLDDSDVAFVFSAARISSEPSERGLLRYEFPDWPAVVPAWVYLKEAVLGDRAPVSPGAALFRLSDLRRNMLTTIPSPSITEFETTGAGLDLLLYLLTAHRYPKVAHVREVRAFFRHHDASITVRQTQIVNEQYLQARIWFAEQHAPKAWLRRLLRKAWWRAVKKEGRWQPYPTVARRFSSADVDPGVYGRLWMLSKRFKYLSRRAFKRRAATTGSINEGTSTSS